MRIQEAIAAVAPMMPGADKNGMLVDWLSTLDLTIKNEILDTHEGSERYAGFTGYTSETDPETELIAPAPYDAMYPLWLEAQIWYSQSEYVRYNNALATFKAAYSDFAAYYNRKNMPKGVKIKYSAETGEKPFDPLG